MRIIIASLLILAVAGASAQKIACTGSNSYTVSGDSATIGCSSYGSKVNLRWTLSSESARVLTWTDFDTESNYDKVTLYADGSTYTYSGASLPPSMVVGPGDVRVTFVSDGSTQKTGWGLTISPGPDVTALVSGQTITSTKQQPGGFVFFSLDNNLKGKTFSVHMRVNSYQGLKPPALFVNRNKFPTLEQTDGWKNTNPTKNSDGSYEADINLSSNIGDGDYFVGVFMYGTSSSVAITSEWTFNIPLIQNGVTVSSRTSSTTYYQIKGIPVNAGQVTCQISREVPGGMVVAYMSQGRVPDSSSYDWVLDTRVTPYVSKTIRNPNPSGSNASNPGVIVIAVEKVSGSAAGYVMQCNWDGSSADFVDFEELPDNSN